MYAQAPWKLTPESHSKQMADFLLTASSLSETKQVYLVINSIG